MKLLILSVSAGGGHINAAEAIKTHTELNIPNSEVKIIDTIKYINPFLDKLIIGSYLKSIRIYPPIFGLLYNYTENDGGLTTISERFNTLMSIKVLTLINKFDPDLIISTHPFSTGMLSVLKAKNKLNKPNITIMTDYAPHNSWIHPDVDAYVVATEEMGKEMALRGVDSTKIFPLGIPVHPDFLHHENRNKILLDLDLDPNKFTLLLMGGSLGMGKILEVYEQISEIPIDFQIIAIAGNNKKLLSSLKKAVMISNKPTKIIGFSDDINDFMKCADLLITKPGGLTISEALISNLPLAIFSAIPGQEEKNAEFLLKHDLAIDLGTGTDCKFKIQELIKNPYKLNTMKTNCKAFAKPNGGKDIISLMEDMIK